MVGLLVNKSMGRRTRRFPRRVALRPTFFRSSFIILPPRGALTIPFPFSLPLGWHAAPHTSVSSPRQHSFDPSALDRPPPHRPPSAPSTPPPPSLPFTPDPVCACPSSESSLPGWDGKGATDSEPVSGEHNIAAAAASTPRSCGRQALGRRRTTTCRTTQPRIVAALAQGRARSAPPARGGLPPQQL